MTIMISPGSVTVSESRVTSLSDSDHDRHGGSAAASRQCQCHGGHRGTGTIAAPDSELRPRRRLGARLGPAWPEPPWRTLPPARPRRGGGIRIRTRRRLLRRGRIHWRWPGAPLPLPRSRGGGSKALSGTEHEPAAAPGLRPGGSAPGLARLGPSRRGARCRRAAASGLGPGGDCCVAASTGAGPGRRCRCRRGGAAAVARRRSVALSMSRARAQPECRQCLRGIGNYETSRPDAAAGPSRSRY